MSMLTFSLLSEILAVPSISLREAYLLGEVAVLVRTSTMVGFPTFLIFLSR